MAGKRLVVGLGNPGPKYAATRHNVGFRVIDALVARYQLGAGRSDKRALTWEARISGERVKLAKPMTFMNRSGESVRQLIDYYGVRPTDLLVVHDDLDTPFGDLRLRPNGGHGGQNGLRSIIQHLGSRDFARLRFGIGRPPGKMDPVNYVLQAFRGDDAIRAEEIAGRAADAIEVWLCDGIDRAMSRFNGGAASPSDKRDKIDLEEQLAIALRAHELAPADEKPLQKLISLQKKLGLIDDAVASHLRLADLLARAGKRQAAIAEKVKAVSIQPSLVAEQREIAEWHLSQDSPKKAVSRYLILAQHFHERDEVAAALGEVKRALAINPQHPKALALQRSLADSLPSARHQEQE